MWTTRPFLVDVAANFLPHLALVWAALGVLTWLTGWKRAGLVVWAASIALGLVCRHGTSAPAPGATPPGFARLTLVHFNAYGEHSRFDSEFAGWLRDQNADLISIVDAPWNYLDHQAWLRERYQTTVEPRAGLEWPSLLLSKFPGEIHPLVEPSEATKFSFAARRSLLLTLPGEGQVFFTTMHPPSPRRESSWLGALKMARRDGPMLRDWTARTGLPVIVAGDFNCSPQSRWNREFRALSSLRPWCRVWGGGTWPSWMWPGVALPIDRVWTTPDVRVRSIRVGPRFKSDHRPIVVVLDVPVIAPGPGPSATP